MKRNPLQPTRRRSIWPVSPARAERLEIPAALVAVAVKAGLSAALLSLFERGLKNLSAEQEQRRRTALAELAAERAQEATG